MLATKDIVVFLVAVACERFFPSRDDRFTTQKLTTGNLKVEMLLTCTFEIVNELRTRSVSLNF